MIWSRTLIRILFNAGFGLIKQDVDIAGTGRTFDDNQWHEFNLQFNLKELNVTLDGVRMIQGLPLQHDPFEFTVDSKPVYIGGSYHDRFGFIGCIRSLYVNGRIFDLRALAHGQEDFGVYPGCGSACPLLNEPCNHGYCIDEFDTFKCNCTVSPNDGKYCGNETYPKKFAPGNFYSYDLEIGNASEPLGEAIFVVGFSTKEENVALAQLEGLNGRHISLSIESGHLRLHFNQKEKNPKRSGSTKYKLNEVLGIDTKKVNTGKHMIARVKVSTEEVFLTIPNLKLEAGANVTESWIDENNRNKGKKLDKFGRPIKFHVSTMTDMGKSFVPAATTYTGCMSGAKLIYYPKADKIVKSFEIDVFKLASEKEGDKSANPSGTASAATERCGPTYKIPGIMPTVGPARQFGTKSPGLDISVRVVAPDGISQAVLLIVAFLLAVIILGILLIIYRITHRNHKSYQTRRKEVFPRAVFVAAAPSSSKTKVRDPSPVQGSAYAESKHTTPASSHRSVPASHRSVPASHRSGPASSYRSGPGEVRDDANLLETDKEEFL